MSWSWSGPGPARRPLAALLLVSLLALLATTACGDDGAASDTGAAAEEEGATDTTEGWGAAEAAEPLAASTPNWIEIPTLGIAQATMGLGLGADRIMEVPPDGEGIGWYEQSPTPGERGPSVFAAHVDWEGQPGVFSDLATLTTGDEVAVGREDGSSARFEVTQVERYPKEEFPTARVYGNTRGAELRLITCSGEFDPDTRSYEDNTVVYAEMVTDAA